MRHRKEEKEEEEEVNGVGPPCLESIYTNIKRLGVRVASLRECKT